MMSKVKTAMDPKGTQEIMGQYAQNSEDISARIDMVGIYYNISLMLNWRKLIKIGKVNLMKLIKKSQRKWDLKNLKMEL